jgi:hypothetical protein
MEPEEWIIHLAVAHRKDQPGLPGGEAVEAADQLISPANLDVSDAGRQPGEDPEAQEDRKDQMDQRQHAGMEGRTDRP